MSAPEERSSTAGTPMVADPLAYLLGLEGVALLRAFAGEYDRAFAERRIQRVRELLEARDRLGASRDVEPMPVWEGYDAWSSTYDTEPNGLLGWDEQVVRAQVDHLPPGVVLDAACGTGRHLQRLLAQGWQGIGVDASPGMLAVARAKLPGQPLLEGRLEELPVADDSVDLVVCTLALEHVADLAAALGEFARVLRPGGRLVVTDTLGLLPATGRSVMVRRRPDGTPGHIASHNHGLDEHLSAALSAGLDLRASGLLRLGDVLGPDAEPVDLAAQEVANIWFLMTADPEAANAAHRGRPYAFWYTAVARDAPLG